MKELYTALDSQPFLAAKSGGTSKGRSHRCRRSDLHDFDDFCLRDVEEFFLDVRHKHIDNQLRGALLDAPLRHSLDGLHELNVRRGHIDDLLHSFKLWSTPTISTVRRWMRYCGTSWTNCLLTVSATFFVMYGTTQGELCVRSATRSWRSLGNGRSTCAIWHNEIQNIFPRHVLGCAEVKAGETSRFLLNRRHWDSLTILRALLWHALRDFPQLLVLSSLPHALAHRRIAQ